MDRRSFLVRSSLASAGFALGIPKAAQAQGVEVRTPLGVLRGVAERGVRVFRGVPFAAPPVGSLRFSSPEPAKAWSGVRDALTFAPAAFQPGAPSVPQSEDCLYLNVWAPAGGGPHPVFVWIHGGGFTGGNSFDPLFDGTQFAQAGVVCVTVAYRLGVFGLLDFGPQLGPAYAGGANHALEDLMAALGWVKANIGAFGGDPHRVTVGGESAGAKLTDLLMGVPRAQPLFQQMISESGGAERIYPAAQSAAVAAGFCKQWTSDSGQPAAALRTAAPRAILASQERFVRGWPAHFPLRTEIDGHLIAQPPLDAIRAGSCKGKRLLIGTNREESAMFLGPHPAHDPGPADLGNMPVGQFRAVEDRYAQVYPEMTAEMRRIRAATAEEYWVPSMRVAEALVGGGGTAFNYRLDLPAARGRYQGLAAHASDLDLVWDHFGPANMPGPAQQQLATEMHTAWVNFILTGTPHSAGLPAWPAYNPPERRTMLLNAQSTVVSDPQARELALWQGLLMH